MNTILLGALIPVGFSAIFAIWTSVMKRETTYKWGVTIGAVLSAFVGQKVKGGSSYEKNEGKLQTTIYDFSRGIIDGMDKDDDDKFETPAGG